MSEYTPGPWWVDDSGNVFSSDGRLVANCAGWQNSVRPARKENVANARLIADAPRLKEVNADLLAACEDLLYQVQQLRGEETQALVFDQAEAAIARAKPVTGGTGR